MNTRNRTHEIRCTLYIGFSVEAIHVSLEDWLVAIRRGRPSVRAWAVFFLALWTSRQIVPLETLILWPASSWDRPSRSTSLKASSSAISMKMGVTLFMGAGVKLSTDGMTPNVTGLGNRPLLPHLCLRRHTSINLLTDVSLLIYQYVIGLSASPRTQSDADLAAIPAIFLSERPSVAWSFSREPIIFRISSFDLIGGSSDLVFSGTLIYFCALSHNRLCA